MTFNAHNYCQKSCVFIWKCMLLVKRTIQLIIDLFPGLFLCSYLNFSAAHCECENECSNSTLKRVQNWFNIKFLSWEAVTGTCIMLICIILYYSKKRNKRLFCYLFFHKSLRWPWDMKLRFPTQYNYCCYYECYYYVFI